MSSTTQNTTHSAHADGPSLPEPDRPQERSAQKTNTTESVKKDDQLENAEPEKQKSNDPLAPIFSEYHKMATQEDKELVNGWNETLNILLTFAGLLSAVITAFLLASQPDLSPKPNDLTNRILLHIAHQLDNATDISQLTEEPASRSSTIRVLTYWHGSLGCSLLSAFGSLLSKQWVLHYQSNPVWANTIKQQSLLREARAYGLSKWRMYAVIEFLPVLLQLAVFLFYLGLAESVYGVSTLFGVTLTFAGLITSLYIFTLAAGAVFPSCPFKSPITDFFRRAAPFAVVVLLRSLVTIGLLFMSVYGILVRLYSIARGGRNFPLTAKQAMFGAWEVVTDRMPRIKLPSPDIAERGLIEEPRWTGSVVFWSLQGSQSKERFTDVTMKVAEAVVVSIPPNVALRMATWRGGFGSWCNKVLQELRGKLPSTQTTMLEADTIFRLIDLSGAGAREFQSAVVEHSHWAVDPPDLHFWAVDTPNLFGYICNSIQQGWRRSPRISTEPLAPLPLLEMRTSTLSVYVRHRLLGWDYSSGLGIESDREHLLQELPIVLRKNPYDFSNPDKSLSFIADVTFLVAIALKPGPPFPYIQVLGWSRTPQAGERLLQVVSHLSYLPEDIPANELVPIALYVGFGVLQHPIQSKKLPSYDTWKSGIFAESLYRLLHLGRMWWHAELGTNNSKSGASLVHVMHLIIYRAISIGIEEYRGGHSKLLCPSPADFAEILAAYAHPDAPQSPSLGHTTEATRLLDFVSSLRYITLPSPRRITLLSPNPAGFAWSRIPSFTPDLKEYPQVIRQLIHDIRTAPTESRLRRVSLSVIIKGQDIFLPATATDLFPDLMSDIGHLADEMFQTKEFVYEMSPVLYATFVRWDELLRALEELQRMLGHPVAQIQTATLETATEEATPAPSSAPEGLEISSTPQDPNSSNVTPDE